MSDIDFEELDRAVNSLIASAPGAPVPPVNPAATIPETQVSVDTVGTFLENPIDLTQPIVLPPLNDISTVIAPVEAVKPVLGPINDSARPVAERPVTLPTNRSLAGQRSSGRFMDVIHPSTNMRSSTPLPDIQIVPPATIKATPVADSQMVSAFISSRNSIPNEQKSLESPFISGAVVNKRPLGAFSNEVAQTDIELSPTGEVSQKPIEPVDTLTFSDEPPVLPDELGGDLLKIESGSAEQHVEPEKPVEPIEEAKPSGPVSISQQYIEKPAETNKKTSSIYDTNVYHKASATGGKKKSGWMWVLWIILLLAVGIGTGAVTYFYVLPLV